jgi:hypothetical protein
VFTRALCASTPHFFEPGRCPDKGDGQDGGGVAQRGMKNPLIRVVSINLIQMAWRCLDILQFLFQINEWRMSPP